jgi:transposase-like protein
MKTSAFKKWLSQIEKFNTHQERVLQEFLDNRNSKKIVSRQLETPYHELKCPHCRASDIVRWGKRNDLRRYKCKKCNRTFNSLTGTALAHLHRKGHWIDYAECLKQELTVREAAKRCGIHRNTAFRWRHRFLQSIKTVMAEKLQGIVEAEEGYFPISYKGEKPKSQPDTSKTKITKRANDKRDSICVLVGLDRNANMCNAVFEEFNSSSLADELKPRLGSDVLLCSKSKNVYRNFAKENHIRHGALQWSKGEHIKKDIVHIKNASAYQQRLREWIYVHFRGVATKYMDNYLAWLRELHEFNGQIEPWVILLRAKSVGLYKDLPFSVT